MSAAKPLAVTDWPLQKKGVESAPDQKRFRTETI